MERDWRILFPKLPERSRLLRLFVKYRDYVDHFLAEAGLLGVTDSFDIELLHPYREGHSHQQLGRKGLSNHRWIIGAKLCVVFSHLGFPVGWSCGAADLPNQAFQEFLAEFADEMVV